MNINSKFVLFKFHKISTDSFIEKYKLINPSIDTHQLKTDLHYFSQLKKEGVKCNCGNDLWVIGSAISGKNCFNCITGEQDSSGDFDIE